MGRLEQEQNRRLLRARDAIDRAYAQPLDIAELVRIASHYTLFRRLENGTPEQLRERGFEAPQIAVINGLANATLFTDAEYEKRVRDLGDRYLATFPRPVADGPS